MTRAAKLPAKTLNLPVIALGPLINGRRRLQLEADDAVMREVLRRIGVEPAD